MPLKPLLMFPAPQALERRDARSGGTSTVHKPTPARQRERLSPQFTRLQQAFENHRVVLQENADGIIPEKVLVLEIIGSVDNFVSAVRHANIEWIGEWINDLIPADEDFFNPDHREDPLSGRLFLTMTDGAALQQLLGLWNRWRRDPDAGMPRGFAKWKHVFSQLKDIRFWDIRDRLLDTGVTDYWVEELGFGGQTVTFEIELWFRDSNTKRVTVEAQVAAQIAAAGGAVVQRCVIEDIRYHSLLAELPIAEIRRFVEADRENIQLLRCDDVMYFRPLGQIASVPGHEEPITDEVPIPRQTGPENNTPVIALLDGMPLEGHRWLEDQLLIDDPDGWAAECPATLRRHGTAMASLLLHGDVKPIAARKQRPIYVRPVLKPDLQHPNGYERIPKDTLPIDLIHRAVVRMFEGVNGREPIAPEVRIINFSVGDPCQLFFRTISPWARLLDWLSWKYKVLFIVSAGNHNRSIELDIPRANLAGLSVDALRRHVISSLDRDSRNRRLLSPAEGINPITVGSIHADNSVIPQNRQLIDVYGGMALPSPINPITLGHRHSVKPEILVAGGRVMYREKLGNLHPNATLEPVNFVGPPGQIVAAPDRANLTSYIYTRGTSNSAALATKAAGHIYDSVIADVVRRTNHEHGMSRAHEVQLIKALLVHCASWGDRFTLLEAVLRNDRNTLRFKDYVSRFLGFGEPDFSRAVTSTDQRVTVLGWGALEGDAGQKFLLPLPPSLSGLAIRRRLTVTLSWLSPTNPNNQKYRRAQLWTKFPGANPAMAKLGVSRNECDWQAVQRGTVQHEIYVGDSPSAYGDNENIEINVSCMPDAGPLAEAIPYGLAVTLEVAEGLAIPIYTEVEARIRPQVPVRAGRPVQ